MVTAKYEQFHNFLPLVILLFPLDLLPQIILLK